MKIYCYTEKEEKELFVSNNTRNRTIASIAVLVKFNQQMK